LKHKIFIDGKEGTTGIEIFEKLRLHPGVEVMEICEKKRKDAAERKRLINQSDLTFLCLPDSAAVEAVAMAENTNTKIVDASTAHRTLSDWAYGFAELSDTHRQKIASFKHIANPGCYASGFIALIYPLIQANVMQEDYPCVCHAVSGYSGGGKKMIAEYQSKKSSGEYSSPRQYALNQSHKHQPEMQKICGLLHTPIFNPSVGNYYAGMTVSIPIHTRLLQKKLGASQIHECFLQHYNGQRFVKVMPFMGEGVLKSGFLSSDHLAGTNDMEIFIFGDEDRTLLCACLDNLGKGASGAAIQNMNIALGFEEYMGLI
jgi:N-acetyl-gamma-glutamyl-phosphate reductase